MKSFAYVCFNGLVNYFNGSVQGALTKSVQYMSMDGMRQTQEMDMLGLLTDINIHGLERNITKKG